MAAKELYDYLSSTTADNDATLSVKPNTVIVEEGSKTQSIHMGDDGSEERISHSDKSIFYCILIWTYRNESDAGTIMDFYHDAAKGNGNAESFKWTHPTDGHSYVVRFDGPLKRHLFSTGTVLFGFPSVRLRVLGYVAVESPSQSPSESPSESPSLSPSASESPSESPSVSPSA